jgi:hypothetical protein
MQIASSGGGFRLAAGTRTTHDLMQIASAAHEGGATVIFSGMTTRPTVDLMQIASSGQGSVLFED